MKTYTEAERATYQPEPCPSCGNPVEQGWIDVTLATNGPNDRRYALGRWDCRRPGCRAQLTEMFRPA